MNERLEYLRGELRAERISMGELIELQSLADEIEPGDVELLEAAGVPEFPEPPKCVICGGEVEAWPGGRGYGHNPEPVKSMSEGRACNYCNEKVVIRARMIGWANTMKAREERKR